MRSALIFSILIVFLAFNFADARLNKNAFCKCKKRIEKRIVGGHEIGKNNNYPWLVTITSSAYESKFAGNLKKKKINFNFYS